MGRTQINLSSFIIKVKMIFYKMRRLKVNLHIFVCSILQLFCLFNSDFARKVFFLIKFYSAILLQFLKYSPKEIKRLKVKYKEMQT